MSHRILSGGVVALLLGLTPALHAQTTVQGGVVVQSGPVRAHVEVNEPPPPPVVVYHEPVREVIVVERIHQPEGNAYGWWKKHGYREVVAYYDGGNYYDHWFQRTGGLRRMVVYERGGRYYRPVDREHWDDQDDDHRRGKDRKHHRDHDDD